MQKLAVLSPLIYVRQTGRETPLWYLHIFHVMMSFENKALCAILRVIRNQQGDGGAFNAFVTGLIVLVKAGIDLQPRKNNNARIMCHLNNTLLTKAIYQFTRNRNRSNCRRALCSHCCPKNWVLLLMRDD